MTPLPRPGPPPLVWITRAEPGASATAFVSIPNRILFSDDPLPTEFREMRLRYCPGFSGAPAGAR